MPGSCSTLQGRIWTTDLLDSGSQGFLSTKNVSKRMKRRAPSTINRKSIASSYQAWKVPPQWQWSFRDLLLLALARRVSRRNRILPDSTDIPAPVNATVLLDLRSSSAALNMEASRSPSLLPRSVPLPWDIHDKKCSME